MAKDAGRSSLAANVVLPAPTREALERDGRIVYLDPSGERGDASVDIALAAIAKVLDSPVSTGPGSSPTPASSFVTRILLPDVGGPEWPVSPAALRRLLLGLRSLIRPRPATAVVTLPPRLSSPTSPNSTWVASLAHLSDACLTLQGFGADPALAAAYAPAHGLLTPHALPNTHTLVAPAVRHSALLGLGGASAGENNLGFRLKRKRFVVETVHLGIEGGTGERRTAPVASATAAPVVSTGPSQGVEGVDRALARVSLEAKSTPTNTADSTASALPTASNPTQPSKPRAKRTVRFGADPELANGASIESTAAAHAKHTHAPGCGHDHVPEHVHWKSPMPSRQGSGEVPRVRAGSGSGARAVLPTSAGAGASAGTSGDGENTHIASTDSPAALSSTHPAPASTSTAKPIRHRSIHIGNPDSDGTSPAAHAGHHHAPGQGHEHANGDVHWKTIAPGAMGVPGAAKSVGAELHERPELFDF